MKDTTPALCPIISAESNASFFDRYDEDGSGELDQEEMNLVFKVTKKIIDFK